MARFSCRVSFDLPPGVTREEAATYVRDTVVTECGSRHPVEDPLFDLDRQSVVVAYRDGYVTHEVVGA
jgi:hypothetical protein